MRVLDALSSEVTRTGEFLSTLEPTDWQRATRCPPMTVFELAVHAWRGGARILEMIESGPVDTEPEKDGVTYFQYDPADVSPGVVERAQEVAAKHDPSRFAAEWTMGWDEALAAAAPLLSGDPVLKGIFGLMHLSEYLRTRIVEVTIHAMDLRDALGLAPDPTPKALEATCDVLRGLLGTDARTLGIDDQRFALVGTGRASLDERERDALGPLADNFPLLA
jgi:uncharacterized protein (TIGR03083 family)